MSKYPYGNDRKSEDKSRVDRVMGYKNGGAVKDGGDTSIHITVGADPKAAAKPVAPPMPPPAPPMMPPPMGGPPAMPPPMGMKRGGNVADDC